MCWIFLTRGFATNKSMLHNLLGIAYLRKKLGTSCVKRYCGSDFSYLHFFSKLKNVTYIMIPYLHIGLKRSEWCDQNIETKIKLFSSNQKGVIDVSRDDVGVLGRGRCETEGEKWQWWDESAFHLSSHFPIYIKD